MRALVAILAVMFVLPASASAADRDCGDFATQAAAQEYFVALGGPASDPDRLDGDADGIACESLPCPCGAETVAQPTPTPPARRRAGRIVRVIDGDTLRVRLASGRQVTVRLIGIDTPETDECGGAWAGRYMRRLAGRGRAVTLVGDPSQDAIDRYGRTLAYVDARGKGDLGRLMVRAGWASVYVFERPFARLARYEAAASAARASRTGVWRRCGGNFHRRA